MTDPHKLVKPLEVGWQSVIDDVLRTLPLRATTKDVAKLSPKIEELSRAYNAAEAESGRKTKLSLEARVAFSFARDVPKGAAAVRELIASNVLSMPPHAAEEKQRPLRILDLGAGLGAMTWGVARALGEAGQTGRIEALLVDEDEDVLRGAVAIARAVEKAREASINVPPMNIDLAITTRRATLNEYRKSAKEKADVVIVGQVLSEIDPRKDPAARVRDHAELLSALLANHVSEHGSLVVIEPALRDRTRHLHAVRDEVLKINNRGTASTAHVFAPCLHQHACPALMVENEWCHEDLAAIDLPAWTAALARAAGLRWQGLTFSFLVLRKDGRSLLSPLIPAAATTTKRFRAISHALKTKGKTELFVCTEAGARERIRQLDRDAVQSSEDDESTRFDQLGRGDVVSVATVPTTRTAPHSADLNEAVDEAVDELAEAAPIDERGRVKPHVAIDVGRFSH